MDPYFPIYGHFSLRRPKIAKKYINYNLCRQSEIPTRRSYKYNQAIVDRKILHEHAGRKEHESVKHHEDNILNPV